jgi:Tol biopolymer transport system component
LLYADSGRLMLQPFDLKRLEVEGSATQVIDDVLTVVSYGTSAYFSASETGLLAYFPGEVAAEAALVWIDPDGVPTPVSEERGPFAYPRLSPNGKRVAFTVATRGGQDIWVHDLERGTRTRLTFGPFDTEPVWTPDGSKIAFSTSASGSMALQWKSADGTGESQRLLGGRNALAASSYSPDGSVLAFYEVHPNTRRDIWMMPLNGDGTPTVFLATEFDEHSAMFSPDGRWLAFVSDESGREEIYIQPYPGPGKKNLISTDGGREPVWSPDGRELFFRSEDKLMAVAIPAEQELAIGTPRIVFEESYVSFPGGGNSYDVSPDGRRFLMVRRGQKTVPTRIHIVLNWLEELKKQAPRN